jgi:hypothetical protein
MSSDINWSDPSELGARLVEQFSLSLAQLIAEYDDDEYDAFTTGYRERRVSLALSYEGLTVEEAAPVPPPSGN